MLEFIESPLFKNWFEEHKPEKSFVCVSPYIKKEAMETVMNGINCNTCKCQILIRGNAEEFSYNQSSDIQVLYDFFDDPSFDNQNFRRLQNLHMKAYLIDDRWLLVTSGNMTNSGLFLKGSRGNAEGGIATDDEQTIASFRNYFSKLWENSETLESFLPKVEAMYLEYVQTMKRKKRKQERKKAVYKAQLHITPEADSTSGKISIKDVPPMCNTEDLALTLKVIKENGGTIRYAALGDILRNDYNCRTVSQRSAENELVANRKMGEERGKAVAYLSLATIFQDNRGKYVKITGLGEKYITETNETQKSIIYDQIRNKEVFKLLRGSFSDNEIDELNASNGDTYRKLREFLYENINGTQQTISRKISICRDWLILMKNQEQA
ncbi:MAG: hypothetical protein IJU00_04730 [Selenomonas sp.]|nr:hypothetical protein [Selenomonas sp.]